MENLTVLNGKKIPYSNKPRLMQPGYAFPVVRRVVRRGYAPGCFPGLCAEGFFRTSDEAILGTQRYFSMQFLIICFVSRLWRGDFRYTMLF